MSFLKNSPNSTDNSARSWLAAVVSREAQPYWTLFVFALLVRAVHYTFVSREDPFFGYLLPGGDNYGFDLWALDISQTFGLNSKNIPFFHGPLYPYFLGMVYLRFGHSYAAAVLCQHAVGAVTAVLLFHLGRRTFGRAVGWMSGIAGALCPLFLLYEGEILSDSLILFVNVLMLCLLIRAAKKKSAAAWLLAGFAVGLAILGRPNNLIFLPVAAIWCYMVHRNTKNALRSTTALVLTACCTVAPATLANVLIGGTRDLVTYTVPVNLYIGNAPDSTGTFATPPSLKKIVEQEGKKDRDIDWMGHLGKELSRNPLSLPRNLLRKCALFWQSGEIPHVDNFYLKRAFSPFFRIPLVFGVIAPVGLVGLVLVMSRVRELRADNGVVILVLFLLVYSTSIILAFVLSRLRLPVLAVLILFASKALADAVQHGYLVFVSRSWSARRAHLRVVVLIPLVSILLGLGLASRDNSLLIRWNDCYNLSGAYEFHQRYDEALRACDEAIRLAPDSPVLHAERKRLLEKARLTMPEIGAWEGQRADSRHDASPQGSR